MTGSNTITLEVPGAPVARDFCSKQSKLAPFRRTARAGDAGVAPGGDESHRVIIGGDAGPFTDPDGFVCEAA